jgi:hypothetical protein
MENMEKAKVKPLWAIQNKVVTNFVSSQYAFFLHNMDMGIKRRQIFT